MTIVQDLRFGLRMLLRNPGYTAVAALSIGLGIGINTLTFSGVNTVLLKPIPVEDPARVVVVVTTDARNPDVARGMSRLNFVDYREKNTVFAGMASVMGVPLAVSNTGEPPETVQGQLVTGNFFDVLGVKAVVGRTFRPVEDRTPGTHLVAVLSYDAWRRYFAADPAVVGRTISLNRQAFTIVGVAPAGFRGLNPFARPVAWLPSMCYQQVLSGFLLETFESRRGLVWQAVARLAPGTSVEQARANVTTIAAQLEHEYPVDNRGRSARVMTIAESRVDRQREQRPAGHGHAHDDRRPGPARGVRQRREPAAREGRRAPARDRAPAGAGRHARADRPTVARREPGAGRGRRPGRPPARRLGAAAPDGGAAAVPAGRRARHRHRLASARRSPRRRRWSPACSSASPRR